MMNFNNRNASGCPCKGCTDRYPACSDHCQKPEYLEYRKRMKERKEAEDKEKKSYPMSDAKKKALWRSQRYSRRQMRTKINHEE